MEKRCSICGDSGNLSTVINGKEIALACNRCIADEELIIIKKPTDEQLEYASKPYSVKETLARVMGTNKPEIQAPAPKLSLKTKQYCISPYKKVDLPINVIDNFNWSIMMARRQRKMSQQKLAESIRESLETIKMIESGCVTEDSDRVINKIENFFRINLRKEAPKIEEKAGKITINRDNVKTLTVGDLIKVRKEIEDKKTRPEEPEVIEEQELASSEEIDVSEADSKL